MENSGGLIRLIVLGDKEAHYVHPKDEIPLSVKNCPPRAICKAVGGSVLEVIATSHIVNILAQRSQNYPAQTLQKLVTPIISPLQLAACLKERRQRNPDKAIAPFITNDSRELGDKIKATIGAIYLTQGISAANLFVRRLLETPLRQLGERLHKAHRVNSPATSTAPQHSTQPSAPLADPLLQSPSIPAPPTQLPHGLLDRISLSAYDFISIVSATANDHRLILLSQFTNRVGHPHETLLGELVFNLCFMTQSVQLLASAAPDDERIKHNFAHKVTEAAKSRFNQGFLSFCPHAQVSPADIEGLKSNDGALDRLILSALFAELYRTGNLDTGIRMLSYDRALDPVWIKLQAPTLHHKVTPWTPFKDLFESPDIAPHLPIPPPFPQDGDDFDNMSSRALKYEARVRAGHSITREQAKEIRLARDRHQFEEAELKRAERFDQRGTLKMPVVPKQARQLRREKAARLAAAKAAETTFGLDHKPSEEYELL